MSISSPAIQNRSGCISANVADCLILADPETCQLAVFNATSRQIWEHWTEGLTAQEIAAQLAGDYDCDPEIIEDDVKSVIGLWEQNNLFPEPELPAGPPPLNPGQIDWTNAALRTYDVWGMTVQVRYQLPEFVEFADHCYAHRRVVSRLPSEQQLDVWFDGREYVVSGNGLDPVRHPLRARIKTMVAGQLIQTRYAETNLFAILHAGAVSNGQKCLLLPGESGSGKSTLTAALVHSGLTYFSDDFVPFDGQTCAVYPFPLAFSVKSGSWPMISPLFPELVQQPVFQHDDRTVKYLAPSRSAHHMQGQQVSGLIFPQYVPNAPTQLEPISSVDALTLLLQAKSWLKPPLDASMLCRFAAWLDATPAWKISYSCLEEAVATVRARMDA